jgi:hypothetical protein
MPTLRTTKNIAMASTMGNPTGLLNLATPLAAQSKRFTDGADVLGAIDDSKQRSAGSRINPQRGSEFRCDVAETF